MQWLTIILLGIAANLDNLGIGLAYGVKKTKIPFYSNVTIACISMLLTFVSVRVGARMIDYISVETANLVGSLLLCLIGVWILFPRKLKRKASPAVIDANGDHIVSFRESLLLGLLLSVNCLAGGVGVGANGISAIWTVLSIGFFSIVTIGASSYFGHVLSRSFIGKHSTPIAGSLLIFIGIFEFFI